MSLALRGGLGQLRIHTPHAPQIRLVEAVPAIEPVTPEQLGYADGVQWETDNPFLPGSLAHLGYARGNDLSLQRAACDYGARVAREGLPFAWPLDLPDEWRPEFEASWTVTRDRIWADVAEQAEQAQHERTLDAIYGTGDWDDEDLVILGREPGESDPATWSAWTDQPVAGPGGRITDAIAWPGGVD